MNPYPEYKNSGLAWLGKVPKHWGIEKLKFNARVHFSNVNKKNEEGEIPVKLCNYVDVYYNSEIGPDIEFMEASASLEEIKKFQLSTGDVLITKDSEEWTDIAVPAYVAVDIPNLLCGYHLAQIRSGHQLRGDFLLWLLSSNRINYQFKIEASGVTRYGLSNHALSNSLVLLPPIEEQKQIADFLKTKTAQIDDLISKKEKIIQLLKEERAATINQAVTRGLNHKVELKDSGITWLGKIPKHWKTKRLKYIAQVNLHSLPESTPNEYEFKYIDIGNVDLEDGVGSGEKINFANAPSRARRIVKDGDTIISTVRTYLKAIAFVDFDPKDTICSTGFAVISPRGVATKFLYYILRSGRFIDRIEALSVGVSYPAINASEIMDIPGWYPPTPEEQHEIVNYLDLVLSKIAVKIDRLKKEIEHLHEYRAAIISEVVTGKIDIRRS